MSNLVLYRKYRPLNYASVVSQEHIKATLQNAVKNDRVGHAYLFTGPRGVGKTTIARIFARAVNCTSPKDGEPCNQCEICKEFLDNTALDLMEIDAASNTGVDNVRELIDHLQFAPARSRYKVIIVDEVHMLSKGAFNALLKTLEEPPKHAIFILATTEIHKVPATIISRTQRFDFKKVSISDLSKLLRFVADDNQVQMTDGALLGIATAADGSFRDGLSLLDQVINYSAGEVTEELIEQVLGLTSIATTADFFDLLIAGNPKDSVNFISTLSFSGKDLHQFHKDFMEYLRKLLLAKTGANSDFGLTEDTSKRIAAQADAVALPQLIKIIGIFQPVGMQLKMTSIASLPLELAAVEAATAAVAASTPRIESGAGSSLSSKGGEEHKNPLPLRGEDGRVNQKPDVLQKVLAAWPQILDKVKDFNHSLIPSLKLAQPVAVVGNELIVLFPYKFHKDALDARKNRLVVDQVLEEVLGIKLMLKPMLNKEWIGEIPQANAPEAAPSDNLVESALKIMGGEME